MRDESGAVYSGDRRVARRRHDDDAGRETGLALHRSEEQGCVDDGQDLTLDVDHPENRRRCTGDGPCSASARNVGTANSGVPMKIRRSGICIRSPLKLG